MIMKKNIWTMLLAAMAAVQAGAVDITDPELIWDGVKTEQFVVHESTKTIYIYTPAHLIQLHHSAEDFENDDGDDNHHSYDDWTIYLMNDIDLNNNNIQPWTIGWTDTHRFAGRFDGQGHTIKNIYIDGGVDNRGLFGWICGGDIVNLRLENVTIVAGDGGNEHVGALCGRMDNHSLISHCAVVNCTVKAMDVNDGDEIGTFCGYVANDCNVIEYCYTDGSVEGRSQIGGIVGKMEDGGDGSKVHHCYFSGKVIGHDEDYRSIVGESNGNEVRDNFYLNRHDGIEGGGGTACTDEQLKAPMLFGPDDAEWVYPLNGYPELKVFLRYNYGDSFYAKNVGHMGDNVADSVPGYLSARFKTEEVKSRPEEEGPIEWMEVASAAVAVEKAIGATGSGDSVVNDNFHTYFSQIPLTTTALGANAFENLGPVNRVLLPESLDSIAYPQRHSVQQAFVLSDGCAGCAVRDEALYDTKHRCLLTAPKAPTVLTIHQELADSIGDYAFEGMTGLTTLYVDTWVEAGRLVDDGDNPPPVFALMGGHAFDGCPEDLNIFIKDGTQYELFLGYQSSGGHGYSNANYWSSFYSEYEDVPNHMFTYFPVNRDETGLATLILPYAVELPDGVKAWWASSIYNKTLYMKPLGTQVVPALTPVLLTYEGTTETLYLFRYEGSDPGSATDYEGNLFKGSADPGGHKMTDSEMMSNFFTLGKGNDNLMGFYPYHPKNNTLPSYIAWLALSDIPGGTELLISFDDAPTDVFESEELRVKSEESDDAPWYDLNGRKYTERPTKPGIYIHNDKKVVI